MGASADAVAAAPGVLDGGGGTIGKGGATIGIGVGRGSEEMAAAGGTTGVVATGRRSAIGSVGAEGVVVPTHDGRPQLTPKPV